MITYQFSAWKVSRMITISFSVFHLDVCKFDYRANAFDNSIKSPGYPNSAIVNSTCVYNIHVFDAGNVVHIGFKDFSFGPNDVLTIYDGANNSVILGPLTGPQDSIRTEPTNSVSVKIVIVTTVTSSVKQRYSIYSREVPKGRSSLSLISTSPSPHVSLVLRMLFLNTYML
jgi:hypothetical protein